MADRNIKQARRNIPERIAKLRGNLSQRAFAREVGVFQQNVNRYENGTAPHTDALITIALKTGVSVDWLLLGRGPQFVRGAKRLAS